MLPNDPESTQTVQALQHQTGEGPLSANREVEIRSLKSEIDVLKKQIAGQNQVFFTGFSSERCFINVLVRSESKGLKTCINS